MIEVPFEPLLHEPLTLEVSVVEPQLLVTVITGVACTALGADTPAPAALTQPLTVCVTVYVALFDTVIDAVVAPLLHRMFPVVFEAVNVDVPQLLTTATVGTDGVAFGAAVPCAVALVQPFTVCVTVYVALFDTVIDAVVAPLLHRIFPVVFEAVSVEVPQLSATVTVGADGVAFGAAVPCAVALVQPFTVCVTVYVALSETVIDAVPAPLLQRMVPVVFEAVNVDVPQLSATVTVGAAGVAFGAAVPCAVALVQPFTVCVTV
jgi:hypothetical protein